MNPKNKTEKNRAHYATAQMKDLSVSSKHCIEICKVIRYRSTSFAKKFLEDVLEQNRAVPFPKFARNVGHKPGMGTGRYPVKASKFFLELLESVEANAQNKGLDASNLKITKVLANRASVPRTGSRQDGVTHRTHLEIEVGEFQNKNKENKENKKESKAPTSASQTKAKAPEVSKK